MLSLRNRGGTGKNEGRRVGHDSDDPGLCREALSDKGDRGAGGDRDDRLGLINGRGDPLQRRLHVLWLPRQNQDRGFRRDASALCYSPDAVALKASILILAVKPQDMEA